MNIFKILRTPKLIVFISLSFLVFSCSQYELNKPKEFNLEVFNNFIENGIDFSNVSINDFSSPSLVKKANMISQLTQVQNTINQHYGTNINLSNETLNYIYSERDINKIKYYLQSENLMNSEDFHLYDNFVNNSKTIGFKSAMNNYENEIVSRDLSSNEFNNYNLIANTLNIIENQNPELFEIDTYANKGFSKVAYGKWQCVFEYVFWVVSVVLAFAACAGPQALFFCIAGVANLVRQTLRTAEACAGHM
jgi:hypothetical protein